MSSEHSNGTSNTLAEGFQTVRPGPLSKYKLQNYETFKNKDKNFGTNLNLAIGVLGDKLANLLKLQLDQQFKD